MEQNKIGPEEAQIKYIPKVLKGVHLPVTDRDFLFFLLKKFAHIPEAKELIIQADQNVDISEIREWYMRCFRAVVLVNIGIDLKPIEVNRIISSEYSRCVSDQRIPVLRLCYIRWEEESPVAIEHLGLPHRVILEMKNNQWQWVPVNTYHNGVVDKRPIDEFDKDDKGRFSLRIKLH